ncbi:MAG: imelysin family protein [Saprospiraceae bacterium]|nr:imelysin family protein [Saprospiraceae bacterium]
MNAIKSLFTALALIVLIGSACNDNNQSPCVSEQDQSAVFQNIADNLIIPGYDDLNTRLATLQSAAQAFTGDPSTQQLEALRNAWKAAYLSWQRVAQYEFGPAEERQLRAFLNAFPIETAAVETQLNSGNFVFDNAETFDKGFPALDYLLYGTGATDADILARYSTDPLAGNYKGYLTAVAAQMQQLVSETLQAWTGGFRQTFIANTGTAAGASLSLLINALNEHYELIKRDKLGIPVGAVTLGFPNPDKAEAFYAGIFAELALEALRASESLYLGRAVNGANGEGLDDYLQQVAAKQQGQDLHQLIVDQFEAAIEALEAVPDPLSETIATDKALVEAAYVEVSEQVRLLKTNLPSQTCIAITYIDNPSDSD